MSGASASSIGRVGRRAFDLASTLEGGLIVSAPARVHFGLINETGLYGRIDGGLGAALCRPRWEYVLRNTRRFEIQGDIDSELVRPAMRVIETCARQFDIGPVGVTIRSGVPIHVGLGSKTSLLMSLAKAMYFASGQTASERELARLVGRGGTSGVGVHLSRAGGIVIDIGRAFPSAKGGFSPSSSSPAVSAPFVLARLELHQYNLIHLRFSHCGPSGDAEREIFDRTCPVPPCETLEAIARVHCQIVPGIIEHDDGAVQAGLAGLQDLGLKKAEWRAQSRVTTEFRTHFQRASIGHGLCLSSMGPTMFVLTRAPAVVLDVVRSFRHEPIELTETTISHRGVEYRVLG